MNSFFWHSKAIIGETIVSWQTGWRRVLPMWLMSISSVEGLTLSFLTKARLIGTCPLSMKTTTITLEGMPQFSELAWLATFSPRTIHIQCVKLTLDNLFFNAYFAIFKWTTTAIFVTGQYACVSRSSSNFHFVNVCLITILNYIRTFYSPCCFNPLIERIIVRTLCFFSHYL